jgi:hypothetical protein
MNQPTLSRILSIVLTAAIALAAVFGYNITIIQHQLAALQTQLATAGPAPGFTARGLTHYTELQAATITATDDLVSQGDATVADALSAASVESSGPITGTSGSFSGPVSTGVLSPDSIAVSTALSIGDPAAGEAYVRVHQWGDIDLNSTQAIYMGDYDGMGNSPAKITVNSDAGTITLIGTTRIDKYTSSAKTANTNTESGTWYSNLGATGAITFTLPTAAAGYNVCFYVAAAQTVTIDPASTNQILALTNAAGDRISNGTQGGAVCLLGLSSTQWGAVSVSGTWADAN